MPDDEKRRLERFGRLRPPYFNGAEGEDAQGFLDMCQRILRTTGILESSGVLFTAFQFSGAAFSWWEAYKRIRSVGAAPLTWQQFFVLFLEKFIEMVRSQEWIEREAKRPRGQGGFSSVPSRGQFYHGRGRPFRHAQTTRPVHHGASSGHGSHSYQQVQPSFGALPAQSSSHAPSAQGSSVPGPSSSYSGARGSLQSPPLFAERGCFECGDLGHIKRHCPRLSGGSSQQRSRPSTSEPMVRKRMADVPDHRGATPPIARGRGRGRAPAHGRGRGCLRVAPAMPPADPVEDLIIEE
ncbi:uncharacterized protein [Nicotiana tomentosiformis]|uniref:uncharacterized protein n=1 Tax=Nicotiana tomentosiformis TaxID=4098 RepID=UPI00388CAA77